MMTWDQLMIAMLKHLITNLIKKIKQRRKRKAIPKNKP